MMMAFARQSATEHAHKEFSGERLLNCYARPHPEQGAGPFIIEWSPGLTQFATLETGFPVRAVCAVKGLVYAACGGKLWQISPSGVSAQIGVIPDDQNTQIVGNGVEIAVAAGDQYFVWDGATLAAVSPEAFTGARGIATIDGYVLIFEAGGQRFAITGILDASSIDPLDFASAESAPDDIVAVMVDHSEVWLFGADSSEIWTNTGAADFPFQRSYGGIIERGCAFPRSVAKEDNRVFWVDDRRFVSAASGASPQVISTPAVAATLEGLGAGADVRGFAWTWKNSTFYALRVPGRPAWIYDASTGLWHERSTGLDERPWIATCKARAGERQIFGGADGRLFTLGGLTDGGAVIERSGMSLPVIRRGEKFTISRTDLDFRTGAGDVGRDAQVMMQATRDGRNWGRERWRSLGRVGEYRRLVSWHGWGQARQFGFRWRITDPIDAALYGARVE